jgi:hypothetical protein
MRSGSSLAVVLALLLVVFCEVMYCVPAMVPMLWSFVVV